MVNQPAVCERCQAKLDGNGVKCYQRNCNYLKFEEDVDDGEVNDYGDSDDGFDFNKNRNNNKSFFKKKSEKEEQEKESDEDGGFLDDVGDGCIWGILKFIWKVITWPFRAILWIFSLFDD